MAQQQALKLEEARLIREKHEEMLRTAKQKNDEDLQRKREVYFIYILKSNIFFRNTSKSKESMRKNANFSRKTAKRKTKRPKCWLK